MPVRHRFTSAIVDDPDTTLVRPTNWNDSHTNDLTVSAKSANYTITDSDEVILATAGAGGITITLPTAAGRTGRKFRVKRVDAGAGVVTVATTSSQTIDGSTTYLLPNQWQTLAVFSDGSNWVIDSAI